MAQASSDAVVLFGATGDLAYKKIFPALMAMVKRGHLNAPIIGVAKAGWGLEQLRARAKESVEAQGSVDPVAFDKLASLLRYADGDYRDPATFDLLRRTLGSAERPLHYLAIPSSLFATVVGHLGRSGCARGGRVVAEKPFGHDLASAQALNRSLLAVFPEEAVFRIDHFLGREPVQNAPSSGHPETLRDEKARVLQAIAPVDPQGYVRGQFRGYRDERGVAADSRVETYAAVRLQIDNWRWAGVPFYIRAGKCLPVTCTEVFVELKAPPYAAFGESGARPNYVRFRLGPDVAIALGVRSKAPGEAVVGQDVELLATQGVDIGMGAYERLLGDAMKGDATLFAREDAVEAEWRIVAPILTSTETPHEYQPGTWGPVEADRLVERPGGLHEPQAAPTKRAP